MLFFFPDLTHLQTLLRGCKKHVVLLRDHLAHMLPLQGSWHLCLSKRYAGNLTLYAGSSCQERFRNMSGRQLQPCSRDCQPHTILTTRDPALPSGPPDYISIINTLFLQNWGFYEFTFCWDGPRFFKGYAP